KHLPKQERLRDRSQRRTDRTRFESTVSKGVSGDKRNSDAHPDRARHRLNQKHSSGIDWKDRSVAAIDHGTRRRQDGGELCSTSIKERREITFHFDLCVLLRR